MESIGWTPHVLWSCHVSWQLPWQSTATGCTPGARACLGADSACSARQLLGSRSLQPTRPIRFVVIDHALTVSSTKPCLCAVLLPYAAVLVHNGPAMGHANSKQLNQAGTSILQAIREGDELTFLQVLLGCRRCQQPCTDSRVTAWPFVMHIC